MMAVFGFLVYELNKCAMSLTTINCKACSAQIQVCESYAKIKDDFFGLLHALPKQAVLEEMDKIKRDEKTKVASVDVFLPRWVS